MSAADAFEEILSDAEDVQGEIDGALEDVRTLTTCERAGDVQVNAQEAIDKLESALSSLRKIRDEAKNIAKAEGAES